MKTEFLKELGLTKDQIKAVMAENGRDVNAAKDGSGADDLQGKVETLEKQLKDKEAEHAAEIAKRDLVSLVDSILMDPKAKLKPVDLEIVRNLIDTETLLKSEKQKEDAEKMIETLQKEKGFLFSSEKAKRVDIKGAKPDESSDPEEEDDDFSDEAAEQAANLAKSKTEASKAAQDAAKYYGG